MMMIPYTHAVMMMPDADHIHVLLPTAEAYRFRPWHTLLIFLFAFSLDVPFLIDSFCGKEYPVWRTGGVIVTGK